MTDEPEDLEEVQRRLDEIQRRKRGGIRWQMSRHTAELAIEAITATPLETRHPPTAKGKQRRRKRRKRLL
jgi:hypothetical protein